MSEARENLPIDLLRYILENIVDHPENLNIEKTIDDLGILITLTPHKDDMGKIIGKNGQTIKSIRTLIRTIGKKDNQRINLKIIETTEE